MKIEQTGRGRVNSVGSFEDYFKRKRFSTEELARHKKSMKMFLRSKKTARKIQNGAVNCFDTRDEEINEGGF